MNTRPGRAAVATDRDRRLHDPDPLAAVVGVGVRVGIRERPHQPVEVLGGPRPVDVAVAVGTLVEEGAVREVLRTPYGGAVLDLLEGVEQHVGDDVDRRPHQLGRRVAGPIGNARCTTMSPVSSPSSIRCAVSPTSLSPLISAQITGEKPVNFGNSESCRFRVPCGGRSNSSRGSQVRQLFATMMSGSASLTRSIRSASGRFARCTGMPFARAQVLDGVVPDRLVGVIARRMGDGQDHLVRRVQQRLERPVSPGLISERHYPHALSLTVEQRLCKPIRD